MRVLDLFSGIGGFSLAAHRMGWQTAAFVEKEPFCQKVLAKNFKGVPIYGDIFEFDGKPFRGAVDIVCGGFPCQPFSAAGKRGGVKDERYLFPETLRVIAEVAPAWVVLENVAGLISIPQSSRTVGMARQANHRYADEDVYEAIYTLEEEMLLNRICEELENEGYAVQPIVVPAEAVGAPHRRDRLWIVANANGIRKRTGHREIQIADGKISKRDNNAKFGNADCNGDASDTESAGLERRTRYGRGTMGAGVGQEDRINDASDTGGARLQGRKLGGTPGNRSRSSRTAAERIGNANGRNRRDIWRAHWLDVALRTCVRRMDDGLPVELDESGSGEQGLAGDGHGDECGTVADAASERLERGAGTSIQRRSVRFAEHIGTRDNRTARLKALGNSIVPQVAWEIFKAIEEAQQ